MKLLDQARHRIRTLHYSCRTEQTYVRWIVTFIRHHGLRHPAEMGGPEIESFLTHLAAKRKISASTQNQTLNAIVFLYKQILAGYPGECNAIRAKRPKRPPVVLSPAEVRRVLDAMSGMTRLAGKSERWPQFPRGLIEHMQGPPLGGTHPPSMTANVRQVIDSPARRREGGRAAGGLPCLWGVFLIRHTELCQSLSFAASPVSCPVFAWPERLGLPPWIVALTPPAGLCGGF